MDGQLYNGMASIWRVGCILFAHHISLVRSCKKSTQRRRLNKQEQTLYKKPCKICMVFLCVYTYILFSVSVYICGLKFLLHNVLKYGIFVVTGFVCPSLQTYINIGKSPSKRLKMRMMQYFKHIEYADKIFLFLLLFDVVYHISNKQTAKSGQAKSVLKKY